MNELRCLLLLTTTIVSLPGCQSGGSNGLALEQNKLMSLEVRQEIVCFLEFLKLPGLESATKISFDPQSESTDIGWESRGGISIKVSKSREYYADISGQIGMSWISKGDVKSGNIESIALYLKGVLVPMLAVRPPTPSIPHSSANEKRKGMNVELLDSNNTPRGLIHFDSDGYPTFVIISAADFKKIVAKPQN